MGGLLQDCRGLLMVVHHVMGVCFLEPTDIGEPMLLGDLIKRKLWPLFVLQDLHNVAWAKTLPEAVLLNYVDLVQLGVRQGDIGADG